MEYKKIVKSIVMVSGLAFSASSMATLNIYANEALIAEKAHKEGTYSFSQGGLSPEETHVIHANVNNMPLEMALKTLTKGKWLVNVNSEAEQMPVSFEGGQSWPYILERLSIDYNLRSHIDWKHRVVTVFSPESREKAIADRRSDLIKRKAEAITQAKKDAEARLAKAKSDLRKQQEENKKAAEAGEMGNADTKQSYSFKASDRAKTGTSNESSTISSEHLSAADLDNRQEYIDYKNNYDGYPYQRLPSDAPYSYVIKKGDTLWGLSDRFLQNPWFWPEIWYINPSIENPHLIYPGDRLVINPAKADK